jgi:hypothetical protein
LFQKVKGILKNGHFYYVQKKGGGGFSLQKIRRDHNFFLWSQKFSPPRKNVTILFFDPIISPNIDGNHQKSESLKMKLASADFLKIMKMLSCMMSKKWSKKMETKEI